MRITRRGRRRRWSDYTGQDCLRVGSYNVHGCRGTDRRADAGRIAQVITELECDTVGLQEVNSRIGEGVEPPQLDVLEQATGMEAIPGLTIVHHDGHYGNALLTRRKVLTVRRHDLSYRGSEPRGALDVELDVDGVPVRVMVTHLGLRPVERRFQVKQMLKLLHDIPKEQPVIVLGDINEWLPLGRPLRWLHGILGHSPAERSFPVWMPMFALDRVWVRPRSSLLTFGVYRSPVARVASDHYPVRAVVAVHQHRRVVPHA
ncbi:MAG: endonuclease/exonuclease/phosphatase family protein [Rhodospirillaceae bacterium]